MASTITAPAFVFQPTAEQNEWFEYFDSAFVGGVLDCLSITMALANTPGTPGLLVSYVYLLLLML